MKKLVTLLFLTLAAGTLSLSAQQSLPDPSLDDFPPLGTCGTNNSPNTHLGPNPAPQNGNGTLGQIYNFSKCGLNYVQFTRRLGRRGSLNGTPQPCAFTISGLPACFVVEKAYLWSSMSGTNMAFNVTVTNPLGNTQVYPAVSIGTGADKCWGYGGTSNYRVDVTASISGNGNYTISGFPTNPPTPQKDTDGATLFIIYSDPNANYQGHMVIHDGCIVGIGGNSASTITGINACANSTFGQHFIMAGDFQLTGTTVSCTGGPNYGCPWNWWNFNSGAVNVTAGQLTANVSVNIASGDCYSWVVSGLYYRTTTCTTCPNGALTTTSSSVPATCSQCNGSATVTVTSGSPPFTYLWSPSNQTTQTATGLCPGNYTVTVSSGCLTSTVVVTVANSSTALNVSATSTPALCYGACNGSANLTTTGGNGGPYTYVWTPSGNGPNPTNLCAGIYTVVASDAGGCTGSTTITITQPPQLTINSAGFSTLCNNACNGQAVTIVQGGTGPFNYNWAPSGGNAPNATGLCAGVYTVTVTDANGCTITDTAIVSQPAPINLVTSFDTSHCGQPDGMACVTASGGNGPYTYLWNPTNQTGSCATNVAPGNYCVTVTDANGCTATACVTVPNAAGVVASIQSSTNATCFNSCNGSATALGTGGVGPYTYAWAPNGGNAATATALCAGVYTVTITDATGCTSTATVTITQPTMLVLTPGPAQTICIGQTVTLTATATGGTNPITITWSPNGPTVSPTTTTTYTVTAVDANGCSTSPQTITITVNPPLTVTGMPGQNICPGGTVPISALASGGSGAGYTYVWSPATGLSCTSCQSPNASPTATTTYTVTVNDNCGTPSDTAQIIVTVLPLPVIAFSTPNPDGCAPFCTTFTNNTPNSTSCNWVFPGGLPTSSNNCSPGQVCYALPGSYSVSLTVTDNNGCTNSQTIPNMITVHPNPVAGFSLTPLSTTILNPEICVTNTASNADTCYWDFGDPFDVNNNQITVGASSPTCHTYTDTGTYCVTQVVVTQYGCRDSTSECVIILPDFIIFIPNAFTPNGDANNETFFPKGEGIDPDKFEMWIFDRWGNNIWYTQKWGFGWDGKANGGKEIAQEDVYVWKIKCYDIQGKKHTYIGHVSLIR